MINYNVGFYSTIFSLSRFSSARILFCRPVVHVTFISNVVQNGFLMTWLRCCRCCVLCSVYVCVCRAVCESVSCVHMWTIVLSLWLQFVGAWFVYDVTWSFSTRRHWQAPVSRWHGIADGWRPDSQLAAVSCQLCTVLCMSLFIDFTPAIKPS